MIIREWRGRTTPERQDEYPAHFRRNVVPELRAVIGFEGADLVRHGDDTEIEYVVLSRWASMEAIHAFAGNDPTRAVVEAGAAAALTDYDDRVSHYESVETVST